MDQPNDHQSRARVWWHTVERPPISQAGQTFFLGSGGHVRWFCQVRWDAEWGVLPSARWTGWLTIKAKQASHQSDWIHCGELPPQSERSDILSSMENLGWMGHTGQMQCTTESSSLLDGPANNTSKQNKGWIASNPEYIVSGKGKSCQKGLPYWPVCPELPLPERMSNLSKYQEELSPQLDRSNTWSAKWNKGTMGWIGEMSHTAKSILPSEDGPWFFCLYLT